MAIDRVFSLVLIFLVSALSACGQKGDLYLPPSADLPTPADMKSTQTK